MDSYTVFDRWDHARFRSNVGIDAQTGCWEWTGTRYESGYGKFPYRTRDCRYRAMPAHRAAWIIHKGPIPEGKLVCHKCDNPGCCNPEHLFLGSHKDNTQDMVRKGRSIRGRKRSRLTEEVVLRIRDEIRQGVTLETLSKRYGLTVSALSRIKTRKTWSHLADPYLNIIVSK